MYRKLTAVLVMICILLSSFTVLGDHWADDTIRELHERGFISSIEDADPDASISRAEFVKLINKCFNYKVHLRDNFADVFEAKWYYTDFAIAKYMGYLTGDESGNVNPESFMTRAECAAMIGRILKSNQYNETDVFSDVDSFPGWASEYISQLSALSIISGYPDGSFMPNGLVSRAEAFKIIQNVDSLICFDQGDGTAENPYVVRTPYQFNHIRDYIWESGTLYFVLDADIDLSEIDYQPIGDVNFAFDGVLDGNGHTVKYTAIDKESEYDGLFAYNAGTIKSLKVSGQVNSQVAAGLIAGENEGNILYCITEGNVEGISYQKGKEVAVGGIAGVNNGYVYSSYNNAEVSIGELADGSIGYVGGICGFNNREIFGCINGGTATGNVEYKGDFVGVDSGVLLNCFTESEASAEVLDPAVWSEKDGGLIPATFVKDKQFAEGSGTENDPYLVSSAEEFSKIRFYPEAHYQLTQDIDLGSYPGFTYFEEFSGVLDGQGHCVKNLTLDRSKVRKSGLFLINSGIIKNLNLEQCNISARSHVAGFANTNYGRIENCTFDGSLNMINDRLSNVNLYLGAFASQNKGTIVKCTNNAVVSVESSSSDNHMIMGGIAGENTKIIDECINNGYIKVSATGAGSRLEIGGITGNNIDGDIYDSSNTAEVSAYSKAWVVFAGGVAALNTGTITKCDNSGKINAETDTSSAFSAGIAAENERAVELSENSGQIKAVSKEESAMSGGIAARNSDRIALCKNRGNITSIISNQDNSSVAGGVVGYNTDVVSDCENRGSISAQGGYAEKGNICGQDAFGNK